MSAVMTKKKNGLRSRSTYQTHTAVLFINNQFKNVVDITEYKLVRLASTHADENIRKIAACVLRDYINGKIAVAWEDGILPVYIFLRS